MLGRVAAALVVYILCVFHWQDSMTAIGQFLGLSGFWALFVPSALIGLSVYRIADLDNWGVWDAAAMLTIGSFAMLAITNNPQATVFELVKGVVSFSVAAILAALTLKRGGSSG